MGSDEVLDIKEGGLAQWDSGGEVIRLSTYI